MGEIVMSSAKFWKGFDSLKCLVDISTNSYASKTQEMLNKIQQYDTDAEAIAADWEAVGKDLKKGMKIVQEELEYAK